MIFELGANPEVWGQGNPEAMIYVHDICISPNEVQIMGSKKDTVKIEKNGVAYMRFHATDMIEQLNKCNEIKMNVVGRANINEWMGNQTAQIFIEDYEIIDNLLEF